VVGLDYGEGGDRFPLTLTSGEVEERDWPVWIMVRAVTRFTHLVFGRGGGKRLVSLDDGEGSDAFYSPCIWERWRKETGQSG